MNLKDKKNEGRFQLDIKYAINRPLDQLNP